MKKLALVGILSVLGLGCGDDDGGARRGADSGLTLMDSGTITLPDTGTPMTMDAGTTPGGECAEPPADLRELNMDPMAMGMLLPRCSSATLTCLMGCEDVACQDACTAMDTTAGVDVGGGTVLDCDLCINYQSNACIGNEGCETEWGGLFCCLEANACDDISCPACTAQLTALQTCAQAVPPASCQPYLLSCFPSAG